MAKLFVNIGDPVQTPYYAASDLGELFTNFLLGVSRLKWVNTIEYARCEAFNANDLMFH